MSEQPPPAPRGQRASEASDGDTPFVDAESWLARRGVERDPIRVAPPTPSPEPSPERDRAPISAREAARLVQEAAPQPPPDAGQQPVAAGTGTVDGEAETDAVEPEPLEDAVADAVAYVRTATASTPMFEGRLARKLADRDHPQIVIDLALERARSQGLVDDASLAQALVTEWRTKGHAPRRIRADLERRELAGDMIGQVMAELDHGDTEAAAFDLARQRAARFGHLDAEAAFRRTVGYLARRGYPEALARKATRQAVFADREDERIAGR